MRGQVSVFAAAAVVLAAGLAAPARASDWNFAVGVNLGDSWNSGSSCYNTGWYHPLGTSYWSPAWNVAMDPYAWSSSSWYRPYTAYTPYYVRSYSTFSTPIFVDTAPVVAAESIVFEPAPVVVVPVTVAVTTVAFQSSFWGPSWSPCWNPCWNSGWNSCASPGWGWGWGVGFNSGNWAFGFGTGGFALGFNSWGNCNNGWNNGWNNSCNNRWNNGCNTASVCATPVAVFNTTNNNYFASAQNALPTQVAQGTVTTPGVAGPSSFAGESRRLAKPAVSPAALSGVGRADGQGGKPLASPATVTTAGVGAPIAAGKPAMTVLTGKPAASTTVYSGKPFAEVSQAPATTVAMGKPASSRGFPVPTASKPAEATGATVMSKPSISRSYSAPTVTTPAVEASKPRVSMPMVLPQAAASKPTVSSAPAPMGKPSIAPLAASAPASAPIQMPQSKPVQAPRSMPAAAPAPMPMAKAPSAAPAPAPMVMRGPSPAPMPMGKSPDSSGPSAGGMGGGKGGRR